MLTRIALAPLAVSRPQRIYWPWKQVEEQFLTEDLGNTASPRYVLVILDAVGRWTTRIAVPPPLIASGWATMLDAALVELDLARWMRFRAGSIAETDVPPEPTAVSEERLVRFHASPRLGYEARMRGRSGG